MDRRSPEPTCFRYVPADLDHWEHRRGLALATHGSASIRLMACLTSTLLHLPRRVGVSMRREVR
jgi:hypothetical protein